MINFRSLVESKIEKPQVRPPSAERVRVENVQNKNTNLSPPLIAGYSNQIPPNNLSTTPYNHLFNQNTPSVSANYLVQAGNSMQIKSQVVQNPNFSSNGYIQNSIKINSDSQLYNQNGQKPPINSGTYSIKPKLNGNPVEAQKNNSNINGPAPSATFTSRSNLNNSSTPALTSCQGCKKNRKCTIIHKNCKLCDSCFIESATVNKKCMICKESMTQEAYLGKLSLLALKCEYCTNTIKYTNAKNRECGCLVCQSCFSKYMNYSPCYRCGE